MDLGLPDTDGFTVTETLREMEKNTQIHAHIVALTAHGAKEFQQSALKSGMDDFLTKPLTRDVAKVILSKL